MTTTRCKLPTCLFLLNTNSLKRVDAHRTFPTPSVLKANPTASDGTSLAVWSKALTMGKTYTFGLVINTSQTNGYLQMYFDGSLVTMTDASGAHTQKLAGNFMPGTGDCSPKVGLYGYEASDPGACDSYIYNVIVGTTLADIEAIPGMVDE